MISGRSREEADGMELAVCGLISTGVGIIFVSAPLAMILMNTDLLTVHKPLLNMIQLFIPVPQKIIHQLVLLFLILFVTALCVSNVAVAETILLIYLGALSNWIILLKNLW